MASMALDYNLFRSCPTPTPPLDTHGPRSPHLFDIQAWFAEIDRLRAEPFMPEGRDQPPPQERKLFE